jgi:hypothetical protein
MRFNFKIALIMMRIQTNKIFLFTLAQIFILLTVSHAQTGSRSDKRVYYRIGFYRDMLNDIKPEDAKAATKLLTNEFMGEIDVNASSETIIINGNVEAANLLENHELDILALPAIDFLKIKTEEPIEPLFVTLTDEKIGNEFLLICNKNDNLNSISELRNKSIMIYTGYGLATPVTWLENLLLENKLDLPEKFFLKINYEPNASLSVFPVFFKKISACIVPRSTFNTLVELNPQLGKSIKIIGASPLYPFGLLCIWSKLQDKDLKNNMRKSTANLNKTTRGKSLLTLFKMSRLIPFDTKYLDNLRNLLTTNEKLKKEKKKKK